MNGPLCAMWEGHCGRPAHLVIDTTIRIGAHVEPLSWLCCDDLRCLDASQNHASRYGLVHVDTRRLTAADRIALTGKRGVAA